MTGLADGSYTMTKLPPFVTVGKYSAIAENVRFHSLEWEHQWTINNKCVYSTNWDQPTDSGAINIGNDVWIGEGVRILPNITIADGAIIGAGAVVRQNVSAYSVVIGNPAMVVKYRFTPEQALAIDAIKWWDWNYKTIMERKEDMKDIDGFIKKYKV